MPHPVTKNGHTYELLVGSRAQVWHGTAYKTTGGLTKKNLFYNSKRRRIVSLSKHNSAKIDRRLEKAGYKPKKGVFTPFRKLKRGGSRRRRR